MKYIIVRIAVNVIAIWLTTTVISNFEIKGNFSSLIMVGIVFGLVNTFIRPIVKFLAIPLTMVTLGLFTLVVNALMLLLTGWLTGMLDFGGGFLRAFFTAMIAAFVISIISTVLGWFLYDD